MTASIAAAVGDQKEDWWLQTSGMTIGPRPELVQKMREAADVRFYMYGLDSFVSEASARFEIATSDETIQEAKDISSDIWSNWVGRSAQLDPTLSRR